MSKFANCTVFNFQNSVFIEPHLLLVACTHSDLSKSWYPSPNEVPSSCQLENRGEKITDQQTNAAKTHRSGQEGLLLSFVEILRLQPEQTNEFRSR